MKVKKLTRRARDQTSHVSGDAALSGKLQTSSELLEKTVSEDTPPSTTTTTHPSISTPAQQPRCCRELLVPPSGPAPPPTSGTSSRRPQQNSSIPCGGKQHTRTDPLHLRPATAAIAPLQNANYATLREIEGRLKSIKNIEKITKTMKIVASTKLTRAQRAMTESRVYGEASKKTFDEAETKPLEGEDKKTLLVVCSSDKGLCGGIHSSLSRNARKMLNDNPNKYDIVVIGEKCKAQLGRSNGKDVKLSFSGIGRNVPTFADAQAIADQVSLLPGDYADIKIMYNHFINAQSYEAVTIEAFDEEAIKESRKLLSTISSPVRPSTR